MRYLVVDRVSNGSANEPAANAGSREIGLRAANMFANLLSGRQMAAADHSLCTVFGHLRSHSPQAFSHSVTTFDSCIRTS
jgi:hypothetical protein